MKFEGTKSYISTEDLSMAVNAAINLERPLLIKGEPGTGKTMLALEVAESLGLPLYEWNIKSTTKAQQGLYEYDAVTRLREIETIQVHDLVPGSDEIVHKHLLRIIGPIDLGNRTQLGV